jgi:hypothetical protein
MKMYSGVDNISLQSKPQNQEAETLLPDLLKPGKSMAGTQQQVGARDKGKICASAGNRTSDFQPIPEHCTD